MPPHAARAGGIPPTTGKQALWGAAGCRVSRRMTPNHRKTSPVGCLLTQSQSSENPQRQENKPRGVPGDIDPADKLHPTISKRSMWDVMQADKRRWMAPNHEEISLVGCLRTQLEPAGYPQRQENKSCGVPRDIDPADKLHPTISKRGMWGVMQADKRHWMASNHGETGRVGCLRTQLEPEDDTQP